MHNEGIIQTGGTLRADNLAVGRGGETAAPDPQREEITRRLEALLRVLGAHADELDHRAEVQQSVQAVAEELDKEKPNRTTALGILTGIGMAVGSVVSLGTAVSALVEAFLLNSRGHCAVARAD